MTEPDPSLTCHSRAKDWRSLLRCVRHADATPSSGAASLCLQIRSALSGAAKGHDEAKVARFLGTLLRRLHGLFSLGGEDGSVELSAAAVLFCRSVGVSPGPRIVLPDSALLAESAPKVEGSLEFEPVVEALLAEVEEAKPRLGVEVMVGEEGGTGLTFLQWLQQLARYLLVILIKLLYYFQ